MGNTIKTPDMTCPLCWETVSALIQFHPCPHRACRPCAQNWMETCERHGHDNVACPHCRQVVAVETCADVLERPYKPYQKTADDVPAAAVDEFTLTWLIENGARQCTECGAWMTNEQEQDPLICLCGYFYCWQCNECALDCSCYHCEFYDHISNADKYFAREGNRYTEEQRNEIHRWVEEARNRMNEPHEESVVEEPCEVYLTTIFLYEEPAEADFVASFSWSDAEWKIFKKKQLLKSKRFRQKSVDLEPQITWMRNVPSPALKRAMSC